MQHAGRNKLGPSLRHLSLLLEESSETIPTDWRALCPILMLEELAIPILIITVLFMPLGAALFALGWGIRSYRARFDLANALASARREANEATAVHQEVSRAGTGNTALKRSRKQGTKESDGGADSDDLTLINGIGPVLSKRLNGIGIDSFQQIASWKKSDALTFGELLSFPGRIENDDWIGQAKKLAQAEARP